MKLGDIIKFRKDLYFDGAVQADWFYNQEKAKKVAENFVFHGKQYYGIDDSGFGNKKRIDTISLVVELLNKINDERANPLSLAIADYGTGKSHFAVTLGHIFSGEEYQSDTYNRIIENIRIIDSDSADKIKDLSKSKNLVIILNGMNDFNLHSEILKAAQKSLKLYGLSDEKLKKINSAIDVANSFFERNFNVFVKDFNEVASNSGWNDQNEKLENRIRESLLSDSIAFDIINEVYKKVIGSEIRWDVGLSVSSIIDTLINEYCGLNGEFEHVIILFDEFGRYLEYASSVNVAKSGESGLQQLFEASQNYEGTLQIINFIQSDIKTYLQRIDQTKNISRYIGRFDASDKYYISSNLETVFANLIQRTDKDIFNNSIVIWQKKKEEYWRLIFENLNRWTSTKGVWKNYSLFRKIIVEGIYPMHPLSTFILTQLSDYLQNRSSLTLTSQYIEMLSSTEFGDNPILIMPEFLMTGDLYVEMLAAEQDGKQPSQQCIRFDNVIKKFSDKLSSNSLKLLRSNLIIRLLRFRTKDRKDVLEALSICSGLTIDEINDELKWLEDEYAILGYDDHACCFDFMEESNGAHDFKVLKKRLIAQCEIDNLYINSIKIQEISGMLEYVQTNFATLHKISTIEWCFKQELYPIELLSSEKINEYLNDLAGFTSAIEPKGRIVWLYANKLTKIEAINNAQELVKRTEKTPIIFMLINDLDNRLFDTLVEFKVLDEMNVETRKKFERHYEDDCQQCLINLKNEFEELKKKRLIIRNSGVEPLPQRLAISLTNIFEDIYPNVIPFFFDGFITKNNNLGGKGAVAYCSIVKMLLSGQINYDVIHNFPSDVRNRIESLLLSTSNTSWKCINDNYQLTPPQDSKVKSVYNEIVDKITFEKMISCKDVFSKYSMSPYGICDEIIVVLLSVVIANMSYCIRMKLDDNLYSINNWKEQVIYNDKQIKIDEKVKKSFIVYVDTAEVFTKYKNIFKRIENNRSIFDVQHLRNQLNALEKTDEVPEELKTQHILAIKQLDSGVNVKLNWDEKISEIRNEFEEANEKSDFYNAVKALELLRDFNPERVFIDNYEFDDTCQNDIKNLNDDILEFINSNIDSFVDSMTCKSVEGINTFRNHHTKIEEKLKNVGLYDYADKIKAKKEFVLANVEKIKSAQSLRSDYNKFMNDSKNAINTTYMNIVNYYKSGKEILERINRFEKFLGIDYDAYNSDIQVRLAVLEDAYKNIEAEITNIWDDLFEAKSVDQIEDLIKRIDIVSRKGIRSEDLEGLEETKDNLNELLKDLDELSDIDESRSDFERVSEELKTKYEDSDFDFEVLDIIDSIVDNKEENFDILEEKWIEKNLDIEGYSRYEILNWLEKTKNAPGFLTDESVEKLNKVRKEAEKLVSKGKVDDVVHYFEKLELSEMEECLKLLENIIKNKK